MVAHARDRPHARSLSTWQSLGATSLVSGNLV